VAGAKAIKQSSLKKLLLEQQIAQNNMQSAKKGGLFNNVNH
jgi:hypothetical protein